MIQNISIKLLRSLTIIGNNFEWSFFPDTARQVVVDVRRLYPSVDNDVGIPAVRRMLESHPNPEGLPTDLIIDALTICLEENFCEFCGEHYKVNHGTGMGWVRAIVVTM